MTAPAWGPRMIGEDEFRRQHFDLTSSAVGVRMGGGEASVPHQWTPDPSLAPAAAPVSQQTTPPVPMDVQMIHRAVGAEYTYQDAQTILATLPGLARPLLDAEIARPAGARPKVLKLLEKHFKGSGDAVAQESLHQIALVLGALAQGQADAKDAPPPADPAP